MSLFLTFIVILLFNDKELFCLFTCSAFNYQLKNYKIVFKKEVGIQPRFITLSLFKKLIKINQNSYCLNLKTIQFFKVFFFLFINFSCIYYSPPHTNFQAFLDNPDKKKKKLQRAIYCSF